MGMQTIFSNLLNRIWHNKSGAFSIMWAIALSGMILTVGATYDMAQLTKAKALAQYTADNMALQASIAVDTNNDDRYVADQIYTYAEISAGNVDFTDSLTGSVQYNIVDELDANNAGLDDENKSKLLARATVTGTYQTVFMGILPQFSEVSILAKSDVAYAAREGVPASIFFVVDNSGSMNNYDDNGIRKINSLETSMKDFMDTLDQISIYGDDIFRTALYPYSYNLLTSKVVDPDWSTLSDYDIDRMYASGGTRSTSALSASKTAFTLENDIHESINGEENPLKFLIFMSDGANNGTQQQCGAGQTVEHWIDTYQGWNDVYYSYQNWFDGWVIHYPSTCDLYSPVNEASLQHCTTMKNQGVKIYSIAYDVNEDERAIAEAFMKECSSGVEDYYKYASDGTDLQAVFDEIGESVITEVIRIKH